MGICVCSRSAYGAASVNLPFSDRRIRRRAASASLPLALFQATPSRARHSSWHREWLSVGGDAWDRRECLWPFWWWGRGIVAASCGVSAVAFCPARVGLSAVTHLWPNFQCFDF